jgi:hypothetical protein
MRDDTILVWASSWTFISSIFLMVVCFQYDSVLSVYVKTCEDGQCIYIPLEGIGFFSAGYLANGAAVPGAAPGDNRVLWSDLTTDNVCLRGGPIHDDYAVPLSLCQFNSDGEYVFVLPSHIRSLQLQVQIAIASAISSVASSSLYLCFNHVNFGILSVGMSMAAMLSSFHCVELWLDWKGTTLYTSDDGFYLPLWAKDGNTIMIERFRLELNNPQFQLLVASVPSFAVGMIASTATVYYYYFRQHQIR